MKSYYYLLFLFPYIVCAQVGINTDSPEQALDVNGKLKIGDDNLLPTEGTIRYDSSLKIFEGYNGTNWLELSMTPSSENSIPQGAILHFTTKKDLSGFTFLGTEERSFTEFHRLITGDIEPLVPMPNSYAASNIKNRSSTLYNDRWYLWGGTSSDDLSYYNSGAYYNIDSGTWGEMSTANAPSGRFGNAFLTDQSSGDLYVWGGTIGQATAGGLYDVTNTGAKYDVNTDTWSSISNGPLAARSDHVSIWTGEKMIIWGGIDYSSFEIFGDGAAYNPDDNSWSTLADSPLSPRTGHTAIWTGEVMIIYGGSSLSAVYNDGAIYNPSTDTWTLIPPRQYTHSHSAVWTGSEMLIAGGSTGTILGSIQNHQSTTVFIYNPSTNSWIDGSSLSSDPDESGFINHEAIWTGNEMVIIGAFRYVSPDSFIYGPVTQIFVYNRSLDNWKVMRPLSNGTAYGTESVYSDDGRLITYYLNKTLQTDFFDELFINESGPETEFNFSFNDTFYLYRKD